MSRIEHKRTEKKEEAREYIEIHINLWLNRRAYSLMYIKRDDEKPLHDTYSTLIYAIYIVPYRSYVKVLEDHTDHS